VRLEVEKRWKETSIR